MEIVTFEVTPFMVNCFVVKDGGEAIVIDPGEFIPEMLEALEGCKLKAIIDFEEACRYYTVFDLGMAILGLCTTGQKIALGKARALVAGYQQTRELERAERDALRLFVEYAATATSFWRFRRHHLHAPSAVMANRHWQMVNVAEQVAAIPRERFLEAVLDSDRGV